jgi:hypothetical protein
VDLKPVRSERVVSLVALAATYEGHDLDHVALFDRNRLAFVTADDAPVPFHGDTVKGQLKLSKEGVDGRTPRARGGDSVHFDRDRLAGHPGQRAGAEAAREAR